MATIDVPEFSNDVLHSSLGGFARIVESYHSDPAFRAKIEADPVGVFGAHGIHLPPGVAIQVHANDDQTLYVTFPPDPNMELADEMLESVAGGSTVGCAGSAMTVSTLVCACAPSSASTLSSSGTASSN